MVRPNSPSPAHLPLLATILTLIQSRDSNFTYLHMHSSRHADLFEDFCRPPSSPNNPSTSASSAQASSSNNQPSDPATASLPGHFLPFESIHLPPHLQPANPEDEDDVVPDMHAAYGINRALGQGQQEGARGGETVWRDLGLGALVDGGPKDGEDKKSRVGGVTGARREGIKTGILLLR